MNPPSPKNPLIIVLAVAGLLTALSSVAFMVFSPKDNTWLALSFVTIFIFILVKVLKYFIRP